MVFLGLLKGAKMAVFKIRRACNLRGRMVWFVYLNDKFYFYVDDWLTAMKWIGCPQTEPYGRKSENQQSLGRSKDS